MKLKLSTLLLLCFLGLQINAQSYKSAIGARLGYPLSASYKMFISEPAAIELTAGFRGWTYYSSINLAGYYQHHFEIDGVDNLNWYVGGGPTIHFWTFDDDYFPNNDFASTSFGLTVMGGLDYKFDNIPLNLSVDWAPTFFFNGYYDGFRGSYYSLAARYVLK